jgi:hypothetical protein
MNFSPFAWKRSELIFVTMVLLVLFSVSFFQLRIGEMKTRDAQRKADVELVARALNAYYSDHGQYPASQNGKIVACGKELAEECEWGLDSITDAENITYIKSLPNDPFSGQGRSYKYLLDDMDNFKIYVSLERSNDPDLKKDLTIGCGINVQCNWYATSN